MKSAGTGNATRVDREEQMDGWIGALQGGAVAAVPTSMILSDGYA